MTFALRPPKLVSIRYANRLQTVNQLHQGWRGVANKGTSPRACGWEAYLPLCLNGRSGARHQPLPYWQFLDRTPLHKPRSSAHVQCVHNNLPPFIILIVNTWQYIAPDCYCSVFVTAPTIRAFSFLAAARYRRFADPLFVFCGRT